jgi:amino acid permease
MRRQAVAFGSVVPLVGYLCWQAIIMGMGPGIPMVPATAWSATQPYTELLPANSAAFYVMAQMCGFFAISAAFLGVAEGCTHFLADLLFAPPASSRLDDSADSDGADRDARPQSPATSPGAATAPRPFRVSPEQRRLLPLLLLCGPAYLVAVLCPQVFVVALQLAGSLRLVLFGLLPTLMVWRGRREGLRPWVLGGDWMLGTLAVLAAAVIAIDLARGVPLLLANFL